MGRKEEEEDQKESGRKEWGMKEEEKELNKREEKS